MASESKLTAVIEAQDNATKTLKKVQGSVEDTGKTTTDIGKKMQTTGLAIAAVGAGLTAYSKSATSSLTAYAGSVTTISRQTGVSSENVSRLLYAFQRSGIEAGAASQVFGVFSKKIVENNEATDKSTTSLGKLGIATKNADGTTRGFNDVLFNVADKFKTMPDGAEKTALAMELFGKQGKQLLPVLNQGSAGLQDLGKQADKLGLTLTQKNLVAVKAYTKAQKDLKDQQQALTLAVGNEALPMWTALAQKTNQAVTAFVGLPEPMHSISIAILAFGGPILTATGAVMSFIGSIGDATPVIGSFLQKVPIIGSTLASMGAFFTNPWVIVIMLIVGAMYLLLQHFQMLQPLLNTLQQGFMALYNLFVSAMKPAIDTMVWAWQQLMITIQPLMPALKLFAQIVGVAIVVALFTVVGAVMAFVVGLTLLVAGVIYAVNMILQFFGFMYNGTIYIFTKLPGQILAFMNSGLNAAANAIANGLRGIESRLSGFNLYNSGVKMLQTFVDGLNHMWQSVYNNVSGGLAKVRKLLPFSDAKEGPLSTLTLSGKRMMTTLADGVAKGQDTLHSSVKSALSLPAGTASLGLTGGALGGQPSVANTSNSQTVNIQQVHLGDASAVNAFFGKLDQDTINLGKGLTAARGGV